LTSDAISRIDTVLKRTGVDFLSPYPAQIALTLSERLIQPLLQWTWMTTVPLRLAMKSARPSLAVANGQFFFIRKSSLVQAGGFEAIKSSVLDDIDLARLLVRNGFHGGVCDGSTVASTRMYSNFSEIRAGYGKSLSQGFGGIAGSLAIATVIAISGLLPFIFAMTGSTAATIALLLVMAWVVWQLQLVWPRRAIAFESLKQEIVTAASVELSGLTDMHLILGHLCSLFLLSIAISFNAPVMSLEELLS
jgi:cellulose synthase/poly-beta-1,6-N-acetylglucosamine synthase-like glycosyltransferase